MPLVKHVQTSFASGVVNPRLAARIDLEHYYQGMKAGENIVPLVQGGVTRRPGLKYIDTAASGRLEAFAFNTEQTYLICFTDLQIEVFKDGVSQATVVSPWSVAALNALGITQSADTMIICHEDYQPRKLVRGATHTSWTLSTLDLDNLPSVDFDDSLSPTPVADEYDLTFAGSWANGDYFRLVVRDSQSDRIWWGGPDKLAERIVKEVSRVLQGLSSEVLTVKDAATNTTRNKEYPGAGSYVSVTGTYPNLTLAFDEADADVDDEVTATEVTSALGGTLATAQTVNGTTRREPVFSATRGWPKHPIFFDGRLYFGGSKYKPTTLFGSVAADPFNFDLGDGLDDEAIFWSLDTDQVNAIVGLAAMRRLQIFTTGSEHVVPESPITPGVPSAPAQTYHGSRAIKPVIIDGATIFVQAKGRQVREFKYDYLEDGHTARSLSLLAPQLFNAPVAMAALKGTSEDDGAYVYLVNGDGTVAVLLTQRDQQVAAWVKWSTDGYFRSVAVVEDEVYFLVERDGAFFIEQARSDFFLDAAVQDTLASGAVITGLTHLEGKTVRVRADGGIRHDQTVSGGQITMERDGTEVEAGLGFQPMAETMPPNVNLPQGATLASLKRIIDVRVIVDETLGLVINGDEIPDRQMDADTFDSVPAPYTGVIEHEPSASDWELSPTLTLSQNDPLPFTVLGVIYEVEVSS